MTPAQIVKACLVLAPIFALGLYLLARADVSPARSSTAFAIEGSERR